MILDDELKKDVRKYVIQLANELEVCKPKIVYIPKDDQHARANITDNTLTLFNDYQNKIIGSIISMSAFHPTKTVSVLADILLEAARADTS